VASGEKEKEREKECPGEERGMHKPHLKVERFERARKKGSQKPHSSYGGQALKSKGAAPKIVSLL
jgi:hypothetical protein